MNRLIAFLFLMIPLITLSGCNHESPTDTVCLLDVSKSITAEGVQTEFREVDGFVDHMHRGDRLVLIPITGNTIGETPGHMLSFTAPTHREPYDHDIIRFQKQAHEHIKAVEDYFTAYPSDSTDILGALDVAEQEFGNDFADASTLRAKNRTLYIFSDFLEDDGTYRFATDKTLLSAQGRAELSRQLQRERSLSFINAASVYLVWIESTDQKHLRSERQWAIQAFWSAYLAPCHPRWTTVDVSSAAMM